MITKATIEEKLDTYRYRVRIPIYNKPKGMAFATPTDELDIALINTLPGCEPNYKVGDVVYVGFDDCESKQPIILGLLYRDVDTGTRMHITAESLTTTVSTNLSPHTSIGRVDEEAIFGLLNTDVNLQKEIEALHKSIKDSELPKIGTGDEGKVLTVNQESNGIEWQNISSTIPPITTANKLLLSTTTSGTAVWSDFSYDGFLKTNDNGVVSVDNTSYQPSDTKLTSISGLSNSNTGFIKLTNGVASLSNAVGTVSSVEVANANGGGITVTGSPITTSGTITIGHANVVTADTAKGDDSKTLTFGGTFTIPSVTYDANGHITTKGTTTMTMPANPNKYRAVYVDSTEALADSVSTPLTLKSGSNITLSNSSGTVTITATDTTYSDATQSASGLMSATDKTKLDGIASGAEVNVQSDWNQSDNTKDDYIRNKPNLATVATTGDYDDLINTPMELPTISAGDASKVLTVNSGETGVEWGTITGFLPLSGGTMTGSILYDKTASDINTKNSINDEEIKLEYYDNASSHDSSYQEESYIKINPRVQQGQYAYLPYVELHNKWTQVSGSYQIQHLFVDSVGINCGISYYDSVGTYTNGSSMNITPPRTTFSGGSNTLILTPSSVEVYTSSTSNAKLINEGVVINSNSTTAPYFDSRFNNNELNIRGRVFGTCNLIDQALLENGIASETDGSVTYSSTYLVSGLTPVKPNTTYTVSTKLSGTNNGGVRYVRFMDTPTRVASSQNFGGTLNVTFTTPSGCKYVKVGWISGQAITPSNIATAQMEQGSSASSYVPYTMDNVELTERCRGWRYRGILYNSAYFDDVNDTELLIVPKIYNYVFQSGHFLIGMLNTSASPPNEFCVRQDNSYGFVATFHKSGNTIVLDSKTADGWDVSQILLQIYTRA